MKEPAEERPGGRVSSVKLQADSAILAAVDNGFDFLGELAKEAIFFVLKSRYGIERFEVPDHAEGFLNGLRAMLGINSGELFRAIGDRLRSLKSDDHEVQALIARFAEEVHAALYGVEHGLG